MWADPGIYLLGTLGSEKRGGAAAAASAPQHGRICDSAIASISATFCTHARVAGAKRL